MNGNYINNTEVFLFDSDKKYTSNVSSQSPSQHAIYQSANYLPTFGGGHDFYISVSAGSGRTENNTTLYWFENNSLTFSNNGKGPLGV